MSFNNNFQKKKLLFIYYKLWKPGGIARVLTNLVNELVEEYDVTILILVDDTTTFYNLDKRVKVIGLDTYQHWAFTVGCVGINKYGKRLPKKQNIKNYLYDFGVYRILNKWMIKNHLKYDTIITCQYKLSAGIALLDNEITGKVIGWEHNPHDKGGVIWNRIRKKYYKNLKTIVAINKPGNIYYDKIGANSVVIYNIMDESLEMFSLDISRKENLIILVANLVSEKNILEFLQIIKSTILPQSWLVKIVGDGPQKNILKEFVQTNQLEAKVEFLGSLSSDKVFGLMKKSKITCLTSTNEGLPTVLIEAMMLGNALIAYDCNYGPSDIINENNGFLIPLYDKEMFIEKLEYLTHNPEVLKELMKSSFEESKKWKKQEVLEKWKKVL